MQNNLPRARLEFTKDTKCHLKRLALDAITKTKLEIKNPDLRPGDVAGLVDWFVGCLEAYADSIPHSLSLYPPKQQKRREAIRSMGTALQRALDIYMALDDGVKRYVFSEAMGELAKAYGEDNPFPNNYQTGQIIFEEEVAVLFDLQIIAKAISAAAENMPNSNDEPIELLIARALESLFFETGIPFTTSETSFAAECLRAVLGLAGIEKDRMDYWLMKAKKHPESISALAYKYRESNEKSS